MNDDIQNALGSLYDVAVNAGHVLADKLDSLIDSLIPRD